MPALHTDLYQLTMAAGYFQRGMADTVATCEMFVRRLPKTRRYLVAAGIDATLDYIADLHFDEEQIAFLRELPALRGAMSDDLVAYLRAFRFSGDVWAVPEGTVMFAGEPFLRVRAPIIEAQLLETFVLSTINAATTIASKAARIVLAARGRDVLEFGTRRTHPNAAVDAARYAYLVGAAGTSNVEAGRRFGIPVMGTAAHMWTMTHDSEEQAFENYVTTFPEASVLLIDTYDTLRGAARAARVAGDKLKGVRLDSGDLGSLAHEVRAVLDAAGCASTQIVASGDLNEHTIDALLSAGAPIDGFGVGTELVTSKDAPAMGGVYKVVHYERDGRRVPVAKFSEGKATYPGGHQVHRFVGEGGAPLEDVLALADEPAPDGSRPLLQARIRRGALSTPGDLDAARRRTTASLGALPATLTALDVGTEAYPIRISDRLAALVTLVQSTRLE